MVTLSTLLPLFTTHPLAAQATASVAAADWPSYNRTRAGDRFSPLTQITTANASQLRPVCTYDTGEHVGFQTGPLVISGIMYFTTDTMTYAMDAASCTLKWKQRTPYPPTYLTANRGVAYDNNRLFRGSGPGHVLALDAATGRTVWDVPLGTPKPGESTPMAPIAWNGMVFIGNAGGDNQGVTGHVLALDQRDGHQVWRFDVVPDTGKARATWGNPPGVPPTGGAFWTSFSLDESQRVLYVPAGNPAPDFIPELRPGDNLYTNSVIALDATTGRMLGYIQLVRNDIHDWDVSAAPVIVTTRGGRQLLASANKDGLLSLVDRGGVRDASHGSAGALSASHNLQLLYQIPVTTRENTDIQLTHHASVRFCPGSQGGNEWNGPAYSPEQNLLVVGSVDWCFSVLQVPKDSAHVDPGAGWSGDASGGFGTPDSVSKWQGWITAVDADSGTVRWRHRTTMPMLGAVTTTAGGLVFAGELTGDAVALDTRTGAELWRQSTGNAIGGGVVTYQSGGKQYLAVAAGMKSPIWPVPSQSSRIVVYGLP
jgi:alcohol dehydrogenase (cytochrome c)